MFSMPVHRYSRPRAKTPDPNTRALPRTLAAAASAVVLLAGAGLPAQAAPDSQAAPHRQGLQSLRAPVSDENFYFVMADRFSNGSTANDTGGGGPRPPAAGFAPPRKGFHK